MVMSNKDPADIFDPLAEVDFDTGMDYAPLPSGKMSGIMDKIFGLFYRKKKAKIVPKLAPKLDKIAPIESNPSTEDALYIPPKTEVQNGLLVNRKSTTEIARDQIKNKFAFTASHKFIYGFSVIILVIGVIAIYSEIPTHPSLIIGMVLVSLAGNVLLSRG